MMESVARDPVQTGLKIAKRRHQLNRAGGIRQPGEPVMRQEDLAALLGVALSTVANWERGKSFPGRYLGAVETALGISLDSGEEVPVYTDPDEARIWGMREFSEPERHRMIDGLRAVRRGARPTGT